MVLLLLGLLLPLLQDGADPVPGLATRLRNEGDRADPQVVEDLARARTRPALDALLESYSTVSTVWMKREIVRSLRQFDGVPDAELPALQRLMDVATQEPEPELRSAALGGLGQCKGKGKEFLALIVNSAADDEVRLRAMELHVAMADADDHAWYRELYKPHVEEGKDKKARPGAQKKEKKEPKKRGEAAEPEPPRVRTLQGIRGMAFDVVRADLTNDEVADAIGDHWHPIRLSALQELDRREDKRTLEVATALLGKAHPTDSDHFNPKYQERPDVRVAAARIVARLGGPKIAAELLKRGTSPDTPEELRRGIAEILASLRDPNVTRDVLGQLSKGQTREKLFFLRVLADVHEEKVQKALERLLFDRDHEVVLAACRLLAERNEASAVPQLQKLLGKTGKEKPLARAALEALVVLRSADPAWIDELLTLAQNEDPDVRNMALQALGRTTDKRHLPKLVEALENPEWSTRLAALDALENLHVKEAIPPIIARMPKEEGRMLAEISDILFRLTGQPFEDNAAAWDNWWKQSGATFELITPEKLAKVKVGADDWRLKQSTRVQSKFFGIRIVSHKVILVMDVSGSMEELLEGNFEGKSGQSRISVAKAEMDRAIESLEAGSYFNLITFSGGVDRWIDGGLQAASEKNRAAARAFVDESMAGGGTNTYDALKEAFADPDVDTIFFLSDGEPTVGAETDPIVIREHVREWNAHRGILVHTVAIGGQHDVLKWLAEDSGGSYKHFD